MNQKQIEFQEEWNKNCDFINSEILSIFGKDFNINCTAYLNLNPIWPRFLKTNEFHLNYNTSNDEMLTFFAFCLV